MAAAIDQKRKTPDWEHRLIKENLVDAVWVVDATTLRYEYITASIEKISGFTADEYLRHTIQERMTSDSFEKVRDLISEKLQRFDQERDVVHTLELELIHKNGNKYWIEIKAKLTRGVDKKIKIIGVTKDISVRKHAEKEKDALVEELQQALSEKEALLEEVNMLRELLPICSGCKRIRDEHNKWWPLDAYIQAHTQSQVTHTICPDCSNVFYGDMR